MDRHLWWILLLVAAALLLCFVLCGTAGCQHSYYDARTIDPNSTEVLECVRVSTWEVGVIDSKNALLIKLYDGTELSLGSTETKTNAEIMKATLQLIKEVKAWYNVVPPIEVITNERTE